MRRFILSLAVTFFTTLLLVSSASAQQAAITTVPNLIRYGGVLKDAQGAPLAASTVGLTFAIYKQQEGGAAIWMETQSLPTDASGNYSALLGSTTAAGLPGDLFSQEEQRWLGIQVQGQAEEPRVLLVSVPYAFKAHEAETLGGKSVSDFVLANGASSTISGSTASQSSSSTANSLPVRTAGAKKGAASDGPTNFSGTTTDQIVSVTQSGAGNGLVAYANATSGNAQGVYAQIASPNGIGVFGVNTASTGSTGGFYGSGVVGLSQATSGYANGVLGQSASPNGSGVLGNNAASAGGSGVSGFSTSTSGSGIGVYGSSASTSGVGVSGNASATTGGTTGVIGGSVSTSGSGVIGLATATSGYTIGVGGQSASPNGSGVLGNNAASAGGSGVSGFSTSTSGSGIGVYGASASTNGVGINGTATATTGGTIGVYGQSASAGGAAGLFNNTAGGSILVGLNNGVQKFSVDGSGNVNTTGGVTANGANLSGSTTDQIVGVTQAGTGAGINVSAPTKGVVGTATATSGTVIGVEGGSAGTGGYGVYGNVSSSTGATVGVKGNSTSTAGTGVRGTNTATSGATTGVSGYVDSAAGIAGAFNNAAGGKILSGQNNGAEKFSVDGSGNGIFAGNLGVTGTLTKGGGSFKIDDPLDPENKYLSHSFVESPDMMNIYNGLIRLDARGEAWVVLPDYFEALNRDFRYQLTSVGAPQPRLYIAREVKGNRFKISGGKAGAKVSWQLTGIRQDAWANAHRIPTEEEKPPQERGKYLHPELFGASADENTNAMLQH